jgi:predicted transcriptional regulator
MNSLFTKLYINQKGKIMAKTITVKLSDENYKIFSELAEKDNRPLSNFIETAVKKFVERDSLVDEFEMAEIKNNLELNKSIKRGLSDSKIKKGRLVG